MQYGIALYKNSLQLFQGTGSVSYPLMSTTNPCGVGGCVWGRRGWVGTLLFSQPMYVSPLVVSITTALGCLSPHEQHRLVVSPVTSSLRDTSHPVSSTAVISWTRREAPNAVLLTVPNLPNIKP